MKSKLLKRILIASFLITVIQNLMIACSCGYYEPVFCRIVNEGHHIVRVVVTDSPTSQMEVKLLENINKEITADTITIYGQDGLSCGEYLNQFNINDTLILAVGEWDFNGTSLWYLEGFCGLHFLRYENGMVLGQISDSLTTQAIQSFKDNLFTCLDMQVPINEVPNLDNQISIFPNPVLKNFQITISQSQISAYEIYNSNGQLIISKILNNTVEKIEVNSKDLINGIYYIRIKTPKGFSTKKFLKI